MNSMKEECEYNKFMVDLVHKIGEIQEKFSNLSNENKRKVKRELEKSICWERFSRCYGIFQSI